MVRVLTLRYSLMGTLVFYLAFWLCVSGDVSISFSFMPYLVLTFCTVSNRSVWLTTLVVSPHTDTFFLLFLMTRSYLAYPGVRRVWYVVILSFPPYVFSLDLLFSLRDRYVHDTIYYSL